MRTILSAICLLYLCVGLGLSQNTEIDNNQWQIVEQDNLRFRVPATWVNNDDSWSDANDIGRITILRDTSSLEAVPDAIIASEMDIELPIGQARQIQASNEQSQIIIYETELVVLLASTSIDTSPTEQTEFFAIVSQVVNTLELKQDNDNLWTLMANEDATIFLRTPNSWAKQASDADTISVTQIFDDVLVSITYRDLGRPFELAEVEEQFETIYNSNSYAIEAQEIINLPVGDALYFQLNDVRVTSTSTHTQLHYAVARENYLIVVTAGADEPYFEDYETTLRQIVDTIVFEMP